MTHSPIRPEPLFMKKPWGGDWLRGLFGARCPAPCGEAWLASTLPGEKGTTVKGAPLARLVPSPVPLVKLLDIREALSVQLHPDHALARELHGPGYQGKWESWYILRRPTEGFVYLGLHAGVEPAEVLELVSRGKSPEDLLRKVAVEPGDSLIVPPGTLHVLTPGAVIFEAQNPSDLTYRLYDWGRQGLDGRPRALHLEYAARALGGAPPVAEPRKPRAIPGAPGRYHLSTCGPVHCELLEAAEGPASIPAERTRQALTITGLTGAVEIRSRAAAWAAERVVPGELLLVPPGAGELLVGGEGEAVLAWLE